MTGSWPLAARGRVRWAFCVVGEAPGPRAWASFCTDAWPSAHLCPLLGRHLATGRPCCRRQSESSWVTAAPAACGPQTRRAPCPPGPAWTPPLAPAGRPLSAAGAAVGAASAPRWWPVTAAAGVTATEQLAGLCRSVAASDRTRSDEDSGSSQSGAGGGPAPPPDPVGAGPPPGSGRWDRRPPLAGRPGPQPPGPRDREPHTRVVPSAGASGDPGGQRGPAGTPSRRCALARRRRLGCQVASGRPGLGRLTPQGPRLTLVTP